MVRRVLTEAEQAVFDAASDKALCFTKLWTMKEAFVKQTGEGLSRPFATLDFAPFVREDRFFTRSLQFVSEMRFGAVITRCAANLSAGASRQVEQRQMEKVLFCEKNG